MLTHLSWPAGVRATQLKSAPHYENQTEKIFRQDIRVTWVARTRRAMTVVVCFLN